MSQFTFLQPKYVKNFKCDGQRCDAKCCKGWRIDIDAATFEKYEKIESDEKEITSKLKYNEEIECHVVQLDDKNFCPFLTEENLCGIQKKYGENFLSFTCKNFPRRIVNLGNIIEYSLSLSCPLAAELALTSYDAMSLEVQKVPRQKDFSPAQNVPEKIQPYLFFIQTASMFILKIADWTIDQRLAVIGFFWKDVDQLIKENKFNEIATLAKSYTSLNFLEEKGAKIFSEIAFDHKKFLEVVIDGIFKKIYSPDDENYINMRNFFMPTIDGNISIKDAEKNFDDWNFDRENFLGKMNVVFSNYVALEIFYNLYPYRVEGSVAHNFTVLVALYKFVEWEIFMTNASKIELKNVIKDMAEIFREIDTDENFIKKISSAVDGEEDIKEIISAFLIV